jgi:hypothetical protein
LAGDKPSLGTMTISARLAADRQGRSAQTAWSCAWFLGRQTGENVGDRVLSSAQISPAAAQRCLQIGQLSPKARRRTAARVLAYVGAPRRVDLHQALHSEHPDGGLRGVEGHMVLVPELPVRRQPGSWGVGTVGDRSSQRVGEPSASELAAVWLCHEQSLASRLKTPQPTCVSLRLLSWYSRSVLGQTDTSGWRAHMCHAADSPLLAGRRARWFRGTAQGLGPERSGGASFGLTKGAG